MSQSELETVHDVAVIGGGIIGASAAQHLVAAGYKTILLERGDFSSGTSSRTSRLQHCGLSYFSAASGSITAFLFHPLFALKSLELARRAMRGRAEFVRSCPERVEKVTFFVPLTASNAISISKARIAFAMLSACADGLPLDLKVYSPAEARQLPAFSGIADHDQLRGAISFTEYQYKWPERIIIEAIVKARAQGLTACNYTEVIALERKGGLWRIEARRRDGSLVTITARAIANTAGVWVDEITRLARRNGPVLNKGAKGANIVLKLPDQFRGIGFDTVTRSGMPFYIIPWGGLHYVGPWDSPAEGRREDFRASEDDIGAIMGELNALFPDLNLGRDDVLYSWAGVRPRTAFGTSALGSLDVMEHDLHAQGLPNFVVFTGGLFMTHRDAGRRITRAIGKHLAPSGAARAIDYTVPAMPDCTVFSPAAVRWAVEQEQAISLAGILRRRLMMGWNPDLGLDLAEETARIAAPLLGWDDAARQEQVDHFRQSTHFFYGKA
ncbi:FAD-dependent oxidoreductase [Mesorhizobium sp.]|jgi:glycerol-3-phosphate dehydrogenase|uniref:FAD-dependent oxidoreductase n=1 Tax=Mesorhizobium sp. TaxID=1871066 RepID=UPI0035658DFF